MNQPVCHSSPRRPAKRAKMGFMQTPSRREFVAAGVAAAALAANAPAAVDPGLAGWSIKKASDQLRAKAVSPVELTEASLKRIEQLNPAINAYITVLRDQALAQ